MVSLLEELDRREVAIRERVAEFRVQVAEWSEQLEAFKEMLSQVEAARLVVREILDDAAADEEVPHDAGPRLEPASPIGVVTISATPAGTWPAPKPS